MGNILVFANQKGGVGKTTSAVNIGAYLATFGKKILLVDFDPQSNLSSGVGANGGGPDIYDVITDKADFQKAIQSTKLENLRIIPSSINLTGANVELVNLDEREYYLKKVLDSHRADFDYIIIDCPPSLGILTLNGLAAADYVLIPLQCEYYALEGFNLLIQTVQKVQAHINKNLDIGGVFFTMYDSRTRLSQEVVQDVVTYVKRTNFLKKKIFSTIIPRNVRLSEAPSYSVPINLYDDDCAGARSYKKLSLEVLNRV